MVVARFLGFYLYVLFVRLETCVHINASKFFYGWVYN